METIIGKSYLTKIPHEGGELSFQYPAFRGTYLNVAEQIDKEKLKRPSSAETASLVYHAWKNPKEQYSQEILSILKHSGFWEFTGNLYLPNSNEEINNGVILETNPKLVMGILEMNKSSLVQKLNKKNPLVKFVPFGYKIKEQTWRELEKNDYIIARYGKEGAQKIAEIASKYKNNPYVESFKFFDEMETITSFMSCLGEGWDCHGELVVGDGEKFGYRLVVSQDDKDDYHGLAFGVEK